MATSWNDDEEAALMYLSHRAQVLYLRGLRRFMDYATGIVGDKRRVSLQQMRECLEVLPPRGSREGKYKPTIDEVRASLSQLEVAGLVRRLKKTARRAPMRFFLPLAVIRPNEEPQKEPQKERHYEQQNKTPDSVDKSGGCESVTTVGAPTGTPRRNPIPPVINKTPVHHARARVDGPDAVDKSAVITERSGWGAVLAEMGFRPEQIFSAKNLAMFGVWIDQRLTREEFEQAAAVAHAKNNGLPGNVAFYGWAVTDVINQRGRKASSGGGYGQGGGYRRSGASILASECARAFEPDDEQAGCIDGEAWRDD